MTDKGKNSLSSTASSPEDKRPDAAVDGHLAEQASPGAEADALLDAQALLAAAVGSHEAAKLSKSGGRVDKMWRTASIVLGIGLIFAGGMLFEDRFGNPFAPQPSVDKMMLPEKTRTLSKLEANGGQSIADIAARVAPSVVKIDIEPEVKPGQVTPEKVGFLGGPRITNGDESSEKSPFKRFGTGVIVRSDGYILTSRHVIAPGATIRVGLYDKRLLPAELIGEDSFSDLALIKVAAEKLPVAHFGSTKGLRAGDWAIAIGSPFGIDQTVTLGIINAIGREKNDSTFHNKIDLIETDAAISPGNSGGPLLNIAGEVIGINTAIRAEAQNISFAIPVEEARKVTMQLLDHGEIARPYLGIFMHDLSPEINQRLGLPAGLKGVLVSQIVRNSPCNKAGIGPLDVLVKVEGKDVQSAKAVREMIADLKPGNSFEVVVWRKGATQTRKILVGTYPSEF
jgi:S1-C subfamily serine protease